MSFVQVQSVSKDFLHRPSFLNLLGRERGGTTTALRNVSLEAEQGKVLVLLGPNGSGKTTLLKLIATMLLPDKGQILIDGSDNQRHANLARRRTGFAVASERSFFPRLTARENLQFFGALEEIPAKTLDSRIDHLLAATDMSSEADTLVMKFSSGMYQKLGLSRALLKDPQLLLLDEPSRSLSPDASSTFWMLLRSLAKEGTTILLASHNFEETMAIGDQVVMIHKGALVMQRYLPQMNQNELRAAYFAAIPESSDIQERAGE